MNALDMSDAEVKKLETDFSQDIRELGMKQSSNENEIPDPIGGAIDQLFRRHSSPTKSMARPCDLVRSPSHTSLNVVGVCWFVKVFGKVWGSTN
jgi:hypothetical protein